MGIHKTGLNKKEIEENKIIECPYAEFVDCTYGEWQDFYLCSHCGWNPMEIDRRKKEKDDAFRVTDE